MNEAPRRWRGRAAAVAVLVWALLYGVGRNLALPASYWVVLAGRVVFIASVLLTSWRLLELPRRSRTRNVALAMAACVLAVSLGSVGYVWLSTSADSSWIEVSELAQQLAQLIDWLTSAMWAAVVASLCWARARFARLSVVALLSIGLWVLRAPLLDVIGEVAHTPLFLLLLFGHLSLVALVLWRTDSAHTPQPGF